jgi:hypothetical protein
MVARQAALLECFGCRRPFDIEPNRKTAFVAATRGEVQLEFLKEP